MKNLKIYILTSLALCVCGFLNAQWTTHYHVDEFGQQTDQSYKLFKTQGTFSDAETTDSKVSYFFLDSGINAEGIGAMLIDVYKHNGSNTAVDSTLELVKINTPSGEVVSIEKVLFTKVGSLSFSKKKYTQLIEAIKEKGNYAIVFNRSGEYTTSSYEINFTID